MSTTTSCLTGIRPFAMDGLEPLINSQATSEQKRPNNDTKKLRPKRALDQLSSPVKTDAKTKNGVVEERFKDHTVSGTGEWRTYDATGKLTKTTRHK